MTTPTTPLWEQSPNGESKPQSNVMEMSLREAMQKYDLVEVIGHEAIIMAERSPDMRELGSSSPSPFTSFVRQEYNSELRGLRGFKKYDEMRKGDGTVRGTMRQIKTPILGARWFVEAASEGKADQNAADFVWWNLNEAMSISFSQVVYEALLMLDFGYYMFEKVWQEGRWNNRNVLFWQKLAPRHPMDVVEGGWEFDANGGPAKVHMYNPDMHSADPIPIKIAKLLVFTFDREAGNIEGISVLRSAYKHWYYKEQLYKIDAIQKERHGIGVPIIILPPNFTADDRLLAQEMGRNIRTNEMAHLVLPPNWQFMFAKLEGQPVDALKSAEHHDLQIQKNIMAPFLDKPVSSDQMGTFNSACRFIADNIADTLNKYAIPQLIGYNFMRVGVPKLRATNIGSKVDLRTLSFALRNFAGANMIQPDDRLEKYLRDISDLPPQDVATRRIIITPQAAGGLDVPPEGGAIVNRQTAVPAVPVSGLPRQSTAAGMRQAQTAGNNGQAGLDRSGG
jgi:hypothetical protein